MIKCAQCKYFVSYNEEDNGECKLILPPWMDEKRNSSRSVWGEPEYGDGCDLGQPITWMV